MGHRKAPLALALAAALAAALATTLVVGLVLLLRSGPSAPPLADHAPAGFVPSGAAEAFDADTLYEKIDGRARLYLSAGFVGLRCQRFRETSGPARTFEAFVYTMRDPDAAFAAYSNQRRGGAAPSTVSAYAYRTENALYLVAGSLYVEIVSSDFTGRTSGALEAFARELVATRASGGAAPSSGPPFPPEGRVPHSLVLLTDSAFGHARLDRVYITAYRRDGTELTAFLAERASAEEARSLADGYRDFLVTNGGSARDLPLPGATAWAVEVLGAHELFFAQDRWFGGVHMADDHAQALALLEQLRRAVD